MELSKAVRESKAVFSQMVLALETMDFDVVMARATEESRQLRPPFKGGVSVCPECEHPLGEFQVCFNCQAQDYEEGM